MTYTNGYMVHVNVAERRIMPSSTSRIFLVDPRTSFKRAFPWCYSGKWSPTRRARANDSRSKDSGHARRRFQIGKSRARRPPEEGVVRGGGGEGGGVRKVVSGVSSGA